MQEAYRNCLLVCFLVLLLIPVGTACLLPFDVRPDATQLSRQVWQLCIGDLVINGHCGHRACQGDVEVGTPLIIPSPTGGVFDHKVEVVRGFLASEYQLYLLLVILVTVKGSRLTQYTGGVQLLQLNKQWLQAMALCQ